MENKYTFWQLCQQYDKIEIPIIQRDYAQGRLNPDVTRIRKNFIDRYLLQSLLNGEPVELDFVYGSTQKLGDAASTALAFIPLDGQQRLTTLFLLHWFLALKEDQMTVARPVLSRFTYETRPSAHDFCKCLVKMENVSNLGELADLITDAAWYDDEWAHDSTISSMLTMIRTFSANQQLLAHPGGLFESLTNGFSPLISFYFIPLEQFGLSENLYIRMNARGKMLTDFENFKSEFFKIIAGEVDLQEQVKDKIEYIWVENLWDFRNEDSFVIDSPFMHYLRFISRMLYYKDAEFRADSYANDFLDYTVLQGIYQHRSHIEFLIFALDHIPQLLARQNPLLWKSNSAIADIFREVTEGLPEVLESMVLYAALRFDFLKRPAANFYDFIRVVRNLVENTADKSAREWPRLLAAIDAMAGELPIYEWLRRPDAMNLLEGFYVPQRKEEIFKAQILASDPQAKTALQLVEEHRYLKGNITLLLGAAFCEKSASLEKFDIDKASAEQFNVALFDQLYAAYAKLAKDEFYEAWGDLLPTALYTQYSWSRLTFDKNFAKHWAVGALATDYQQWSALNKTDDLQTFLLDREKEFIARELESTPNLSQIRSVKSQLYIYYILQRKIMQGGIDDFFKNGYNFGWLGKITGLKSIFQAGIAGDEWFEDYNPIFQTYQSQFRYNIGLKEENALPPEIVNHKKRIAKPFNDLIEWATRK